MMGHEGIAHPGVTPEKEGSSRNYQFYYMWISCLLCLQVLHDFLNKYEHFIIISGPFLLSAPFYVVNYGNGSY